MFTVFGPLLTEPHSQKRGTFDSWNQYNYVIVYQIKCIVSYFYAFSKWMDVKLRSRDTTVLLSEAPQWHGSFSVYTYNKSKWAAPFEINTPLCNRGVWFFKLIDILSNFIWKSQPLCATIWFNLSQRVHTFNVECIVKWANPIKMDPPCVKGLLWIFHKGEYGSLMKQPIYWYLLNANVWAGLH